MNDSSKLPTNSPTNSQSTTETIESFITRIRNGHLRIKKDAVYISLWEEPLANDSLALNLAHLMTIYQQNKHGDQAASIAEQLLTWIDRAYTHGVIEEGPGTVSKLDQCQNEKRELEVTNSKLQSDIEKLSSELSFAKGRILELERGRRIITRVEDG